MVADIEGVEAARLDFPGKVKKATLISQHPRLNTELDRPRHDPTLPIGSAATSHTCPTGPAGLAPIHSYVRRFAASQLETARNDFPVCASNAIHASPNRHGG